MNNEVSKPEQIRRKILHILRVYPLISPTMLQISMGPNIKAAEWHKVLNELEESGLVCHDQVTEPSPAGRYNTHRRIYLQESAEVVRGLATAAQEG